MIPHRQHQKKLQMRLNKVENKTVYEHQALTKKQGLSERHLELLERFRGDKEDESFPYYSLIHNGVKFKHYVGVLNVGGMQIEVLPKTDNSDATEAYWRGHLLTMLRTVYKLQAKSPTEANQKLKSSPILDVFLQRFLEEVEWLLHMGLIKTYRKDTDNRYSLKGKLVMNKHLAKNIVHKERFYVNFATYDRNHVCNRILYQTLHVIPDVTNNSYIANRARTLCFEFPELYDIVVNDALFNTIQFDRKSEDYKNAIEISKLILLNYMPDRLDNRNSVLALMFDMNRLWEEYVYIILRRNLKKYDVSSQVVKRYWVQENGAWKTIRPDIVIRDKNKKRVIAILDTKWKCPDRTPSDGDLHQMYVYSKMFATNKTALTYPSTNESSIYHAHFLDNAPALEPSCDMLFLKLDKIEEKINEWLLPPSY